MLREAADLVPETARTILHRASAASADSYGKVIKELE